MALKKASSGPAREDPQQYVLKKNYKKAIEIYRLLVKDAPDDPNVILRLADCLVLDGQSGPAVSEYKRAATLYGDQGFLLKAIGVNKKIVKLDPSQSEVHQSLSKLYEERGLLASASSTSSSISSMSGVSGLSGSTSGATGGSGTGNFQFDMEESAGDSSGLDIGLGLASSAGTELDATTQSDPDAELGVGDIDFSRLETGAAASRDSHSTAGGGFEFSSSTSTVSGIGDGDSAGEMSVDALGDALSDLSMDASAATLDALSDEFSPDSFGESGGDASELAPAPRALAQEKIPLFSDFTPAEFVQVVEQMEQESYSRDQVIVREGDPGDSLYVLVTGSVRVVTNMKGRELKLADLGEGDFFGEGSLITGKPRTATILANEDSELLTLSRSSLNQILATHPRVMDVMKQFYQQRAESTVRSFLKTGKK